MNICGIHYVWRERFTQCRFDHETEEENEGFLGGMKNLKKLPGAKFNVQEAKHVEKNSFPNEPSKLRQNNLTERRQMTSIFVQEVHTPRKIRLKIISNLLRSFFTDLVW